MKYILILYHSAYICGDICANASGAGGIDLIDASKGNVTTAPRLDGPSPCAPVPELPTVLLLAVGLALLAGYVRVGRRKTGREVQAGTSPLTLFFRLPF